MKISPSQEKKIIKGTLFLTGAPKTGTTLLLALFDSHPQVFAFPFELKYHKLFNSVSKDNLGNLFELNNLFLKKSKITLLKNQVYEDPYNTGNLTFKHVDFNRLKNYLYKLPKKKYKRNEYFLELAFSLMEGLNEKRKLFKYLIEKPGNHVLNYIEQVFNDFPTSKIIHVIREPKDSLASTKLAVKKYRGVWGDYDPVQVIKNIKKSFDVVRHYYTNERYMVIKYEEIVLNTKKTMHLLAEWLGISYTPSLQEPSILGHPWTGNSSSDQSFSSISKNPIGRAQGVLNQKEIDFIELILRDDYKFFNYPLEKKKFSSMKIIYLKLIYYYILPINRLAMKYLQKLKRIHRYPYYFKVLGRFIFNLKSDSNN